MLFSLLPLEVKERSVMVLKLNVECKGKIIWILDQFDKKLVHIVILNNIEMLLFYGCLYVVFVCMQ